MFKKKKRKKKVEFLKIKTPKKQKLFLKAVSWGTILFLALVLFSLIFVSSNTAILGTKIAGVNVGGMNEEEVLSLLEEKSQNFLAQKITFECYGKKWEKKISDFDLKFSPQKTAENLFSLGKKQNILINFKERTEALFLGKKVPLDFQINDKKLKTIIKEIVKEIEVEKQNPYLKLEDEKIILFGAKEGINVLEDKLEEKIVFNIENLNSSPIKVPVKIEQVYYGEFPLILGERVKKIISRPFLIKIKEKTFYPKINEILNWFEVEKGLSAEEDLIIREEDLAALVPKDPLVLVSNRKPKLKISEKQIQRYLKKIKPFVEIAPKDAKLAVKNSRVVVIVQEKEGEELPLAQGAALIKEALKTEQFEVNLQLEIIKPTVRRDNIEELGLKELIGQGVSSFSGSTFNRIHNIKTAANKFDGLLLKPGEEFSFNKKLGKVSRKTGYVLAPVIKNKKIVLEYGGGICQVATTAFRVAFFAGLPITERAPHGYKIGFYNWPYGPGFDATVYSPSPDLRFKNDTGAYILIQTYIKQNRLYFDFYGTKTKKAVFGNSYILSSSPDGALTVKITRIVYNLNGVFLKKEEFLSKYNSPLKYIYAP